MDDLRRDDGGSAADTPASPGGGEASVRTVKAYQLIAGIAAPHDSCREVTLGPVGTELSEILAQHVRVADIHDERQFYDTFADHLRAAQHSSWMWAPWTTGRMRSVLPVLADAVRRGVTVVVFVMQGECFARKLLDHEQVRTFAKPPVCGKCGSTKIDLRRTPAKDWYWRCYAPKPQPKPDGRPRQS